MYARMHACMYACMYVCVRMHMHIVNAVHVLRTELTLSVPPATVRTRRRTAHTSSWTVSHGARREGTLNLLSVRSTEPLY